MEEIREAAFAFYEAGSVELKQSAKTIFDSMDVNKDGTISILEFANFLKRNNYPHKQELFQEIDRDHNGYLDFWEVVVFFYITKTRMIWCDGCNSFIEGTYFICSDCFCKTGRGYDLCRACYRSQKYQSGHGPFLDNYAMLNAARNSIVHHQQNQAKDSGKHEELKQFLKIMTLEAKAAAAVVNLENASGCSIM